MRLCRLMLMLATLALLYSVVLLGFLFPWILIAAVGLICVIVARRGVRLSAFGTARWADADDLERSGMLGGEKGLIVGRMDQGPPSLLSVLRSLFDPRVASLAACEKFLFSQRRFNRPEPLLVRLAHAVHCLICAPTGVGKGISFVLPHLLSCPDSTVVVDFKGENAMLTASHRRKVFGHQIIILDPFKVVTQRPDSFNPLDFIDRQSSLALDECRDLAAALVVRTGQEKEPHWVDSAEVWIAAMIAVVAEYGEPHDRSLQTVRTLLSDPQKLEAVIKLMCDSNAWEGMLARLGHQLTHFKDKELSSTLTTTNRFLRFLDTLAIADSTKASTFDPDALREGKMTVYLVLPPEHMRAQSALLRMWIGGLMRAVVRGGLQEAKKVHFVLDEAASIGHLEALDDAVDKYRGYGIRLQFYYQSLGQIKKCFPDGQDQTLLSNTSQVFFGVNDQPTAEYVSSRLGESTIVVASGGTSKNRTTQTSDHDNKTSVSTAWNTSDNWQQQARKLLKPEEVLAVPAQTAVIFTPGVPPMRTTLIRHFEEPKLGHKPGWFLRLGYALKIVSWSVFVAASAFILAGIVTVVAQEKRLFPQQVPNGLEQRKGVGR